MSSKYNLANLMEKVCLVRIKQLYLIDVDIELPTNLQVRRTIEDGSDLLQNFINERIKTYKLPIIICKSIINNNINEKINKITIERFNQDLYKLMNITEELVEKNILNEKEYLILCSQYKKDKILFDNFVEVL